MITLTLADEGKFDLPPESIHLLEQDGKGCMIAYNLGTGPNEVEHLKDNYGFVKKLWGEAVGPLSEVTLAREGKNNKLSFRDGVIIAKKELKDAEDGAKTRLTIQINGAIVHVNILDSRDSLA